MHNIIQLKQGIKLIWEKIESLISNKKEKYFMILSKLYISTNPILYVNRQILHVNVKKCIDPKIPCAIYKFHGFSRFFMRVIKFQEFSRYSRLVNTLNYHNNPSIRERLLKKKYHEAIIAV